VTLAAVYDNTLSRVRLTISGAPAAADYSVIERSADQVTWVTVRGGDTVPLTTGAGTLDDYEFEPSVPNYYRASHVDSAAISYVNQGSHATGNNVSVVPGLPAGLAVGDLMVCFAAAQTGAPSSPPAGWLLEVDYGPVRVYSKRYAVGDTAPTVAFTGGVAGASTSAFIIAWRNMQQGYAAINGAINASAQNITTPPLTTGGTGREVVHVSWKSDGAASSASTLTGFGGTVTLPNALGNGQSLFFSRVSAASNWLSVAAGTLTVTGGVAAISRSLMFAFRQADYVTQDTATLTPAMDRIWIKNLQRPYLNRPVTVTDWTDVTRPARAGVLEVISRSMPVAVTDLRGSQRYTLTITVPDLDQADDLDLCFSAGEPVLIHVPNTGLSRPPGMYAVILDTTQRRTSKRTLRRYFDLPLVEVAAPAGTIVGETVLWSDIVATFATWADLIAAEPTWADVVDRIGSPTDLITG
jgi:hypothetical protein